ncbi:hypothetical protein G6W42_06795 [Campylobacter concisus]|jgi:hypothetical protein|uniref:hypothetical protein n=1 Tax=Campylobacter concisus TaxID=199 RepID=UPI0018843696|nr:hypothetical protein [Campylobacter concisus]MBE9852328.1 hypothetical protein [Campylobacter concisus]
MKKIFIFFMLVFDFAFASVWSSSGEDGINQAFQEYNQKVKELNQKVIEKYNGSIKPQAEKVVKNDELKQQFLTNHRELLKVESVERQNANSVVLKLKAILDNEATR